MAEDPRSLSSQISPLLKSDWVDLGGLISCVAEVLSKPPCTSISSLGHGSYNYVYKLVFSDDTEIAASIPTDVGGEAFQPHLQTFRAYDDEIRP